MSHSVIRTFTWSSLFVLPLFLLQIFSQDTLAIDLLYNTRDDAKPSACLPSPPSEPAGDQGESPETFLQTFGSSCQPWQPPLVHMLQNYIARCANRFSKVDTTRTYFSLIHAINSFVYGPLALGHGGSRFAAEQAAEEVCRTLRDIIRYLPPNLELDKACSRIKDRLLLLTETGDISPEKRLILKVTIPGFLKFFSSESSETEPLKSKNILRRAIGVFDQAAAAIKHLKLDDPDSLRPSKKLGLLEDSDCVSHNFKTTLDIADCFYDIWRLLPQTDRRVSGPARKEHSMVLIIGESEINFKFFLCHRALQIVALSAEGVCDTLREIPKYLPPNLQHHEVSDLIRNRLLLWAVIIFNFLFH